MMMETTMKATARSFAVRAILLMSVVWVASTFSPSSTHAQSNVSAQEVHDIGVEAYIYFIRWC